MFRNSSARPTGARPRAQRYRTVFISDLHLGTPGCKADCLLDFLQHVESEYLYLIGDVVDGWRLKKKWFWPERHRQVLRALLARGRRGTRVVYLPGNHDEALRKRIGRGFAGVRVLHDAIHQTADGRRLLVIHGDTFDPDLGRPVDGALQIPKKRCRAHAGTFSWRRCAEQFLANLRLTGAPLAAAAE